QAKRIDLRGKSYLAPLTTVGNLPYRRICKEFGVDVTCSEMMVAFNFLSGGKQEMALPRRHVSEDIFGVQIAANSPSAAGRMAEVLAATTDIDFIDLNCGCPVDAVTERGAGSGLMRRQAKLIDTVAAMRYTSALPITVKLRTGYFDGKPTAHKLMDELVDLGVSAITLHGRTREQRYSKVADWSYITTCAAGVAARAAATRAPPVAFFGNGDIFAHEDYQGAIEAMHLAMRSAPSLADAAASGDASQLAAAAMAASAAGVMVGRGALIKPWVFKEMKEGQVWDISSSERFDMLRRYARYGIEFWGSDAQGLNATRRFLCEWQSFLYRYVPAGLLEVLPQRMNERPPAYFGRDELETLMASDSAADWIALTNRIPELGPADPSFRFLPKHKSNAY
ncbi:hypothetical protein CXG81DRAFT_5447, partial [Caulochytrium protostelioides]